MEIVVSIPATSVKELALWHLVPEVCGWKV